MHRIGHHGARRYFAVTHSLKVTVTAVGKLDNLAIVPALRTDAASNNRADCGDRRLRRLARNPRHRKTQLVVIAAGYARTPLRFMSKCRLQPRDSGNRSISTTAPTATRDKQLSEITKQPVGHVDRCAWHDPAAPGPAATLAVGRRKRADRYSSALTAANSSSPAAASPSVPVT